MKGAMMSNAIKIAVGVLVALLMALPWLVNPYVLQVFILTFTYSMLGLAFALTIKVGLPRFDVAAWFGVGAYSTALLMLKGGLSFWPAILIGGIIAVVLGWIIFAAAIPRGMMVFLMFGMATAMTIYQVFGTVRFFGGWSGTPVVPPPTIGSFVFVNKPALYYLGFLFLVTNIAVYRLLYNSRIGRAWNAMGSSLKLASSVGINVVRYRMANVLIGNFFIALAGGYFVAYSLVASPANFGFHNSLFVMMYAVVGGLAHSLAGPIVGAFVLTFTPEYFRVAKEYESIITAVVMILIIIFMPTGILGFYEGRVKHRFTRINWIRRMFKAGSQCTYDR
jgi:branched-chain amino acid transport system permease protein